MRILIDHQAFSIQKTGGVSRIYKELIDYFSTKKDIRTITPYLFLNNEYFRPIKPNIKCLNYLLNSSTSLKFQKKILPPINNLFTKLTTRNRDYDIYMPSYYDTYFLEKTKRKKIIIFVYDMIHEKFPEYFRNDQKTNIDKEKLINIADKIICISENTKKDLEQFYPHVDKDKIKAIPISHSISKVENVKLKNELPKEYILYVGTRKNYKNFSTLYDSFLMLSKTNKNISLLCIGGNPFTESEINAINKDNLAHRVFQQSAHDKDLYTIYNNAKVFVFPSLYEGFGIPILEAMYSGCPVITSKSSSMGEVAGEAAHYCDVSSDVEITNSLMRILEDEDYRTQLIEKGFLQAASFSWEKTCREVESIIRATF